MQSIYTWIQANPEKIWAILTYLVLGALASTIPSRAQKYPHVVGWLVRMIDRANYLTHHDTSGTLKWPLIGRSILEAIVETMPGSTPYRTPPDGPPGGPLDPPPPAAPAGGTSMRMANAPLTSTTLLAAWFGILVFASVSALLNGCGATVRDTVVAAANVTAAAANVGGEVIVETYCSLSMGAIGRGGLWDGHHCLERGPRAGTPATEQELAALQQVRQQWAPVVLAHDEVRVAHDTLVAAIDAGAADLLQQLANLAQHYGQMQAAGASVGVRVTPLLDVQPKPTRIRSERRRGRAHAHSFGRSDSFRRAVTL